MQMIVIWIVSGMLAVLPLLMAAFFLFVTLPRKKLGVKQDLRNLAGDNKRPGGNAGHGDSSSRSLYRAPTDDDVDKLVDEFFNKATLSLPAGILTLFYLVGFALCDSYINVRFNHHTTAWLFPFDFVQATRPLLYAFGGVYLFNLGNILRRLYLDDINDQVFWGAVNRLWLSIGLAWIVLKIGAAPASEAVVFFIIGFVANIILDWLIEEGLKLLRIRSPKSEDLPLQMVKGINIWKEYRLEEEGIENVQNLATADAVELSIRTQYNFRTLIDWIDQSILLTRLTSEHVKSLTAQGTAISAVEFAAASPANTGNSDVADALARVLKVEPVLMRTTMDMLFYDEYVLSLWDIWQRGKEPGPALKAFGKAASQ